MATRAQLPSPVLTNTRYGLSNDEIASRFPAVFADQPHESRGTRYMMVPTYQILDGLRTEGYVPTTVMHQRARTERPGLVSHGKHLIRFSHINDLQIEQGERHEVIMVNSHNGTSSYQFMSGLFRLVCENGCIFGNMDNSLKVRHTGNNDLLQALLNATFQIATNSVHVMEEIELHKQIILSWDEQRALAEAAMVQRFDKVTIVEADDGSARIDRSLVPFQPDEFLRARHPEDYVVGGRSRFDTGYRDLNTTYQVLQENLIEQPVRSQQQNQQTRRRSSTRALNGIDGRVNMNGALWYLTQQMAQLKGAE